MFEPSVGFDNTSFVEFVVDLNSTFDYAHGNQKGFDVDRYSRQMRILYFYGILPMILFCIISVGVNIKILMSVGWIRRPLSPTLHISLSLTGADAFASTAFGIGLVVNSFIPCGLGIRLSGWGCFLLSLEAVRLSGVMITVAHLVALSINHYLGIVKPLHYLTIMTHRITTFLMILLWTLPLIFFFSYFGAIENEGFRSEDCAFNPFLFQRKFRIMYSSLFFGPFILMVCIYAHIFLIVKKHQASRLKFSQVGYSFQKNNVSKAEREEHSVSQQVARNIKAVNTTLFILGSFVVGWLPATILYVLDCEECLLRGDWIDNKLKFFVYVASNSLIILKTLINPIIYAARMHEIQVATKRMHSFFCGFRRLKRNSEIAKRTHSSDGPVCNRFSGTGRTINRMNANAHTANNNQREENFKYSYRGKNRYSRRNISS